VHHKLIGFILAACATFVTACDDDDEIPKPEETNARSGEVRRANAIDAAAARQAFSEAAPVFFHPRCMNCHPVGDRPLQLDQSVPHAMDVQRGADGLGRAAMRCYACHQTKNLQGAHMPPGAPTWHLPPEQTPMVFEDMSVGDLCRQMKDPARNGGKTVAEIVEHVTHDELVLWGWHPGNGRTPVSMPHDEFAAKMAAWADNGAACPG
jgi:hypothetical protein